MDVSPLNRSPISVLGLSAPLDATTAAAASGALASASAASPAFADALVSISAEGYTLAALMNPPAAPSALPAGPLGATLAEPAMTADTTAAGNAAAAVAAGASTAYADQLVALQASKQTWSSFSAPTLPMSGPLYSVLA